MVIAAGETATCVHQGTTPDTSGYGFSLLPRDKVLSVLRVSAKTSDLFTEFMLNRISRMPPAVRVAFDKCFENVRRNQLL